MGNSFEGWGNEENQVGLDEELSVFTESEICSIQNKDLMEEKAENILIEMENSYQRLEKVLKVFNRMM
jgi:hypothetical protein